MKRLLPALLLLSLSHEAFSYDKYWIVFTDKNNSPYSVTNPTVYLSQRSIQRRQNQSIPVTVRDLPPNPSYVQQVLATGAVTLNYRSRWFNAISITTTDANALTAIGNLSFVQTVTPVKRLRGDIDKENTLVPTTEMRMGPLLQPQAYNYGASFGQINQIAGDCLHNQGFHGEGMVIAVLDAGFANLPSLDAFDSLFANNQILGTWDFVSGNANVYDDDAHGEMVLSCMGGYLDGQIVGTAPKAQYWLLRTEDATSEYVIEEDHWVAGAEFADSVGADIINSSLGYTTFDDPSQNHTYADMNGNTCISSIGADFAVGVGMFVCASAGNSGSSSWFYIGAPADGDSVLAVGAVDLSGTIAGFSSHGPTSDGQIKPDVSACGAGATVADQANGINTSANGTSFASPITCGAVACLWQAHPTMTSRQLYNAIIMSASQYNSPDNDYGYGIPNFCNASLILSGANPPVFAGDKLISVYPNPFAEEFNFGFYAVKDQELTVQIVDLTGRVLMEEKLSVKGNSYNPCRIKQFTSVASGIYILSIVGPDNVFAERIVKQ